MSTRWKFTVIALSAIALYGCTRLGVIPGSEADVADGLSPQAYNWRYVLGLAWPVALPFVRFVPVVGPVLQAVLANVSWSTLATKKQKIEDK